MAAARCTGHVDARFNGVLVRIEADELPFFRNIDPGFVFLQIIQRAIETITKGIGHSRQLHIAVRAEALAGSTRSAATATNQGNLDRIIARRMDAARQAQTACQCTARDNRRILDKLPTRRGRVGQLRILMRHL
jgi:hypothetical protein